MIRNNILMPWIALSYSHDVCELERTNIAVDCALKVYKAALTDGIENYLDINNIIKPVFRKYN
jgi:glutamate-1-semialdehyde 2,1-aminomutase